MPDAPIWISEAEVVGLISLPEAIDLCLAHNDFQVCAFTPFRPVPASKPVGAILLSTLCAGRGRFT